MYTADIYSNIIIVNNVKLSSISYAISYAADDNPCTLLDGEKFCHYLTTMLKSFKLIQSWKCDGKSEEYACIYKHLSLNHITF